MTLALFDPQDFRIAAGISHVCAAGETPFLKRHDEALRHYAEDKSNGMVGRLRQESQIERARAGLAWLWHVGPDEIGFVSNVAEGVSIVAESLAWRAGDNICIDAHEYPSVVGPFALRRSPAIELRTAAGGEPDRVAALVNERTRLIGVSAVSYLTGERFDLDSLRKAADRVGAVLVVDYTQASGYLPIEASIADFAFSACYKWMLGTTGVGIAYWNRKRQPAWMPASAGWNSMGSAANGYDSVPPLREDAMRFTRGNPAHMSIYVLNGAMDYLSQFEMNDVRGHVQTLTCALLDRLESLQIPSTTPRDPARHGASVCVASPRARAIVDAMAERGVWAWNGHGRVRFSFHGYNSGTDVDRIADALRDAWQS
jgi:selenocysteine lyase/cysteine desulfurase